MDDFILRAAFAGLALALAAGPVGCFVVWRRSAYFGEAVANASLLGVALGLLLGISQIAGVIAACALVALLLVVMEQKGRTPGDAAIGILAHASLAFGLIAVSLMPGVRVDLMSLLIGDILAVSWTDVFVTLALAALVALAMIFLWRPLLSATLHEELAAVEGVNVLRARLVFMLLVAAIVAIGMKLVGILLIVSLLIVPAAAARSFSRTPRIMALGAAALGALSVLLGLWISFAIDAPTGPSIVAASAFLFAFVQIFSLLRHGAA